MPSLKKHLINKKDTILIAFSGGKDSVVLLDLLTKELPLNQLAILHVDHKLRETSWQDAMFSKKVAKQYGVRCFITELNMQNVHANIEAIAREGRYQALFQVAKTHGFKKIATAHTKSDNLEQFFIRLYRGTSLDGLGGIAQARDSLIRPLLGFTSQDVLGYIQEHGLVHIEDESNQETVFLRNKIRHDILPQLQLENYDFNGHILQLMEQISRDNAYFKGKINACIEKNVQVFDGVVFFDIALQKKMEDSIKFRFIHTLLYRFFHETTDASKLNQIIDSMKQSKKIIQAERKHQMLQISKGITFYFDANYIAIFDKKASHLSLKETKRLFEVLKPNITYFKACEEKDLLHDTEMELTSFTKGDRFEKYNDRQVKLKDIFIDHKIPYFLRQFWPLLVKNKKIIALPFIEKGSYYNPNKENKK